MTNWDFEFLPTIWNVAFWISGFVSGYFLLKKEMKKKDKEASK